MSTPEEASEYLSRTNFKSVIEWVTAEALLNRPEDPVTFVRNLLEQKIDARGTVAFAPEQPTEYVRACYAEASNLADEHGVIHGKALGGGDKGTSTGQAAAVLARLGLMERLLVTARRISADSLNHYDTANTVIKEACEVVNADRASLFVVAKDGGSLHLVMAPNSGAAVAVPLGVGLAGGVAQSGKTVNISDCYADSRFDPSFDKKTGYKTTSMVVLPIQDAAGAVVGVLQVVNKAGGGGGEEGGGDKAFFDARDEEVLRLIAGMAGVALTNGRSYSEQSELQAKLRAATDLVRSLQAEGDVLGVAALVREVTGAAPALAHCERATTFLVDAANGAMWAMQGGGEAPERFSLDSPTPSVSASVAKTGCGLNIPDAAADARFDSDSDRRSGRSKTRSLLVLPLKKQGGEVVGVLELANKIGGVFEEEDEEVLGTFLDLVGPLLAEASRKAGGGVPEDL